MLRLDISSVNTKPFSLCWLLIDTWWLRLTPAWLQPGQAMTLPKVPQSRNLASPPNNILNTYNKMARTPAPPHQQDLTSLHLTRLLSRLEPAILSPNGNPRLRTNKYDRAKVGAVSEISTDNPCLIWLLTTYMHRTWSMHDHYFSN